MLRFPICGASPRRMSSFLRTKYVLLQYGQVIFPMLFRGSVPVSRFLGACCVIFLSAHLLRIVQIGIPTLSRLGYTLRVQRCPMMRIPFVAAPGVFPAFSISCVPVFGLGWRGFSCSVVSSSLRFLFFGSCSCLGLAALVPVEICLRPAFRFILLGFVPFVFYGVWLVRLQFLLSCSSSYVLASSPSEAVVV